MADLDDNNAEIICSNADCQVAKEDKCVEGFEIEACPHYGHPLPDVVDNEFEVAEETTHAGVGLISANTLTTHEASQILRAGIARVIAIIGSFDSGKTSLIASLYDLFQEGPVAGVEFAGTRTIHAFEQACHDARAASLRDVPHINRTPMGEVRFYHLDVRGGAAGDALALTLSDRAGEQYRGAADDVSIVTSFPEVKRADSLTLLVDGKRLLDAGERHNLRSELTMILQALIDGGAAKVGQRLAVVLTKIDLVQSSPNQARAEADFESLLTHLVRLFGNQFSIVKPFRVAASPKTKIDDLPRGTGVADLLTFWLEPTISPPTVARPRPNFIRSFARLQPLEELET